MSVRLEGDNHMNELKEQVSRHLTEVFQGETQEVTARKLNTTQGNVSKWVSGSQVPTSDMLCEISKAYKVSVDWIFGISPQKEIDGVVLEKLTYVYSNDQLIAITKELTEELRKSRTVDWEKKESARAGMRRMVKRLLKKYKYPPEGMEDAVQTVINQCEMWSGNQ